MQTKTEKRRYALVMILVVCVFALFLFNLLNIQVFSKNEENNSPVSVAEVPVKPIRGVILDRNGYPLVDNKKINKVVFIYSNFPKEYEERNKIILDLISLFDKNKVEWNDKLPVEIKKGKLVFSKDKDSEISYLKSEAFLDLNYYATVENCFDALVSRYHLENYSKKQARDIASVYYYMVKSGFNSTRSFEFSSDVSDGLVSLIKEKSDIFPGVDVEVTYERYYPDGTIAPHILGSVGKLTAEEYESKKDDGYTLDDSIGKSGIESAFESELRGSAGVKRITIDADGKKSEEYITEPVNGNTVILTIRKDLQKVAQDALRDCIAELQKQLKRSYALTGAVVVMDTRNNECLAVASYPNYDNSTYQENSEKLNKDPNKPLWNRALRSIYTPGSTIKPAVAMAGLEEGVITKDTYIYCSGIYKHYADYQPGCTGFHGGLNVITALYHSCNIFFYETARRLGIEKLNKYFKMFGLGESTGIELYESEGTVDSVEFRESRGEIWTPGLTIQAGIGHADNKFTPIQLCSYVSTIANKGTRYKASLVRSIKSSDLSQTISENSPTILSKANFAEENWDLVYKGMLLVGTKSYANFSNVPVKVAAKTGTTTVFKRINGRKIETYNGFLISFAPYEDPEIAIAVAVEGAGSGGSTAMVTSRILEHYFKTKETEERTQNENILLK